MKKIVTPRERIDQMIAQYEELERAAHDLMDLHVQEMAAQLPGIPIGVLKQCEFTNHAGHSLNVPNALRLLRDKF